MKASKIILPILLVLLLVIAGGIYFSSRNKAAQVTQTESPIATDESAVASPIDLTASASSQASSAAMASSSAKAQEIVVTGQNFSFTPAMIKVKKGQLVKITFKNQAGTHNFVIPELNVATKTISGGASETVSFTPTKAGSFEYSCSVGNHRQMGMKGTLIVE